MKITDTQKCLEALQRAGSEGVHSFHLNQVIGTTRAAARIQDLKDQGYNITSKWERMGQSMGVRYFLHDGRRQAERTITEPVGGRAIDLSVGANPTPTQNKINKPIRYDYKGNFAIPVFK